MTEPKTVSRREVQETPPWLPGLMIIAAASLVSLGPLLIHLTAQNSNPFLFNSAINVTQAALLAVSIFLLRQKYFLNYFDTEEASNPSFTDETPVPRLRSTSLHLSRFTAIESPLANDKVIQIHTYRLKEKANWCKLPVFWAIIGGLDYGFLAWAAIHVETAIATTVFELWPLIMVYGLARHERSDYHYRNPTFVGHRKDRLSREQFVLLFFAAAALVFMLSSQSENGLESFLDIISFSGLLGVGLALIAAVLASLGVTATLVYGRLLYYSIVDERQEQKDATRIEDRGIEDRRLLLWLTMLGFVIAKTVSLPINIVVGAFIWDVHFGFDRLGLLGSIAIGVAFAANAILLRAGNIRASGPEVNTWNLVSPVLALLLLISVGIALPRFDLFVVGAALVISINLLIQLKPEQQEIYERFGKLILRNTRFGFVAFILSIWMFGTVLYLRDDFMPSSWLRWSTGDYLGLIGLSATIFALILGFRVARLTARINTEDEMMIELYNDCEYLYSQKIINAKIFEHLSDLDMAKPTELSAAYRSIRAHLESLDTGSIKPHDVSVLNSIRKTLDKISHSKQLGRDVVELISLSAFATVTIGIGLLARPMVTDSTHSPWNAFLLEAFVLIFCSTIAFLVVNLFDLRNDRETPIMEAADGSNVQHGVFFRFRRDLGVQNTTAILISIVLSGVFCWLLYDKWL